MTETFEIPIEGAEAYEERFVPAIFAEWAPRALAAAEVVAGSRLLDVACGTGIVARTARDLVGDTGRVVGVDLNDAMLTVAARVEPRIEWRQGDAADLPIGDAEFDTVICQMAMMFFPDRAAAFAEMRRVLTPGGRAVVVVPASLDEQPAYRVFTDVTVTHAGADAASLLGAYWACGDLDALVRDATDAGLTVVERATIEGTAHFDSAVDFVTTEIAGSPLADRIDTGTAARIGAEVGDRLAGYRTGAGFDIPLVGHVLSTRP